MRRTLPAIWGIAAAIALLALYLAVVTLAEGRAGAAERLREDGGWFLLLLPGFGLQVGLFVRLRGARAASQMAGAVTGTSAATSTTAMLACCAHLVPTFLPIVGASMVATFLAVWKTEILIVAILLNLAGAAYTYRTLRRLDGREVRIDPMCGMRVAPPFRYVAGDGSGSVFGSATCRDRAEGLKPEVPATAGSTGP